ncbi:hypothetical protein [Pusillimonas sp.]|uniref:hypothetical protein n=1 Tax=Pusillimonas sp. TaxID=3040095 RepID=UPI0037CBA4F1
MGLDPFTRATKEVKVTISLDVFCDSLQAAIDYNLSGRMNWSERQQLFVLTIDNVRKFVSPPVGTSLTEYINISPREFMQILGTEGGQAIRKTLWVDLQHGYWRSLDGIVLVTDFRFDHEVPALDQIVVVTRPGITRVNNHKSEDLPEELTILPTDKYEGRPVAYVHNRGSMEHLESLAVSLASNLVRGPVKG